MSKTAISMFVYGLYMVGLGVLLIVAPNFLLAVFSMPATSEVWIRVAGILVLFLGIYDALAARNELTKFFLWSVYTRASVILFFTAYVLLGYAQSQLILFGVVDLLAATWTALALRSDKLQINPSLGSISDR